MVDRLAEQRLVEARAHADRVVALLAEDRRRAGHGADEDLVGALAGVDRRLAEVRPLDEEPVAPVPQEQEQHLQVGIDHTSGERLAGDRALGPQPQSGDAAVGQHRLAVGHAVVAEQIEDVNLLPLDGQQIRIVIRDELVGVDLADVQQRIGEQPLAQRIDPAVDAQRAADVVERPRLRCEHLLGVPVDRAVVDGADGHELRDVPVRMREHEPDLGRALDRHAAPVDMGHDDLGRSLDEAIDDLDLRVAGEREQRVGGQGHRVAGERELVRRQLAAVDAQRHDQRGHLAQRDHAARQLVEARALRELAAGLGQRRVDHDGHRQPRLRRSRQHDLVDVDVRRDRRVAATGGIDEGRRVERVRAGLDEPGRAVELAHEHRAGVVVGHPHVHVGHAQAIELRQLAEARAHAVADHRDERTLDVGVVHRAHDEHLRRGPVGGVEGQLGHRRAAEQQHHVVVVLELDGHRLPGLRRAAQPDRVGVVGTTLEHAAVPVGQARGGGLGDHDARRLVVHDLDDEQRDTHAEEVRSADVGDAVADAVEARRSVGQQVADLHRRARRRDRPRERRHRDGAAAPAELARAQLAAADGDPLEVERDAGQLEGLARSAGVGEALRHLALCALGRRVVRGDDVDDLRHVPIGLGEGQHQRLEQRTADRRRDEQPPAPEVLLLVALLRRRDVDEHLAPQRIVVVGPAGQHDGVGAVQRARAARIAEVERGALEHAADAERRDHHRPLVVVGDLGRQALDHHVFERRIVGLDRVQDQAAVPAQVAAVDRHRLARRIAADVEGVAPQAAVDRRRQIRTRRQHDEAVVALQAVDLELLDAEELDEQPRAEDAVVRDDEGVAELRPDDHDLVQAGPAVDAHRGVLGVLDEVRAQAALDVRQLLVRVDRLRALQREGPHGEAVVPRPALQDQARRVVEHDEAVLTAATEDRRVLADPVAQEAARRLHGVEHVVLERDLGELAQRGEHLTDLEAVIAAAGVDRRDRAVVVEGEIVVAVLADDLEPTVLREVVVDALRDLRLGGPDLGDQGQEVPPQQEVVAEELVVGAVDVELVRAVDDVGRGIVQHRLPSRVVDVDDRDRMRRRVRGTREVDHDVVALALPVDAQQRTDAVRPRARGILVDVDLDQVLEAPAGSDRASEGGRVTAVGHLDETGGGHRELDELRPLDEAVVRTEGERRAVEGHADRRRAVEDALHPDELLGHDVEALADRDDRVVALDLGPAGDGVDRDVVVARAAADPRHGLVRRGDVEAVGSPAEREVQRLDASVGDGGHDPGCRIVGCHPQSEDRRRRQRAEFGCGLGAIVHVEPVDVVLTEALDEQIGLDPVQQALEVAAADAGLRADVDHVVIVAGEQRVRAVRQHRHESVAGHRGRALDGTDVDDVPARPTLDLGRVAEVSVRAEDRQLVVPQTQSDLEMLEARVVDLAARHPQAGDALEGRGPAVVRRILGVVEREPVLVALPLDVEHRVDPVQRASGIDEAEVLDAVVPPARLTAHSDQIVAGARPHVGRPSDRADGDPVVAAVRLEEQRGRVAGGADVACQVRLDDRHHVVAVARRKLELLEAPVEDRPGHPAARGPLRRRGGPYRHPVVLGRLAQRGRRREERLLAAEVQARLVPQRQLRLAAGVLVDDPLGAVENVDRLAAAVELGPDAVGHDDLRAVDRHGARAHGEHRAGERVLARRQLLVGDFDLDETGRRLGQGEHVEGLHHRRRLVDEREGFDPVLAHGLGGVEQDVAVLVESQVALRVGDGLAELELLVAEVQHGIAEGVEGRGGDDDADPHRLGDRRGRVEHDPVLQRVDHELARSEVEDPRAVEHRHPDNVPGRQIVVEHAADEIEIVQVEDRTHGQRRDEGRRGVGLADGHPGAGLVDHLAHRLAPVVDLRLIREVAERAAVPVEHLHPVLVEHGLAAQPALDPAVDVHDGIAGDVQHRVARAMEQRVPEGIVQRLAGEQVAHRLTTLVQQRLERERIERRLAAEVLARRGREVVDRHRGIRRLVDHRLTAGDGPQGHGGQLVDGEIEGIERGDHVGRIARVVDHEAVGRGRHLLPQLLDALERHLARAVDLDERRRVRPTTGARRLVPGRIDVQRHAVAEVGIEGARTGRRVEDAVAHFVDVDGQRTRRWRVTGEHDHGYDHRDARRGDIDSLVAVRIEVQRLQQGVLLVEAEGREPFLLNERRLDRAEAVEPDHVGVEETHSVGLDDRRQQRQGVGRALEAQREGGVDEDLRQRRRVVEIDVREVGGRELDLLLDEVRVALDDQELEDPPQLAVVGDVDHVARRAAEDLRRTADALEDDRVRAAAGDEGEPEAVEHRFHSEVVGAVGEPELHRLDALRLDTVIRHAIGRELAEG